MRIIAIILALLAAPAAADVPTRTLFFPAGDAPQQVTTNSGATGAINDGPNVHNFIYISSDQWSFWWQGRRVAAQAVPDGITIQSVTPTTVMFNDNGTPWQFTVGKFEAVKPR